MCLPHDAPRECVVTRFRPGRKSPPDFLCQSSRLVVRVTSWKHGMFATCRGTVFEVTSMPTCPPLAPAPSQTTHVCFDNTSYRTNIPGRGTDKYGTITIFRIHSHLRPSRACTHNCCTAPSLCRRGVPSHRHLFYCPNISSKAIQSKPWRFN